MSEALRLSTLVLFAVGPLVAVLALVRRGLNPSPTLSRIRGWRWYVPVVLLPVEWLLPPSLIALRFGEIEADWLPVRVVGLAVGLSGVVLLVWASVLLGRFLIHEAAVRDDHALVENGPYRFVRHPVYAGYLVLLLGSGVASLNVFLWLLWPVSLLGILIQAASEEQLLGVRFGQDYERYVRRTGRLIPRFWGQAAEPAAADLYRSAQGWLRMDVPERWRGYPCEDYFSSPLAHQGYWDEQAQLWLIEPADRVEEDTEAEFLQVGRPGVDSIGFGYRKGQPGLWAFHRIVDREFQLLAPTVTEFLAGWHAGEITV